MSEQPTFAERATALEKKHAEFKAAPALTKSLTAIPLVSLAADLLVDMARAVDEMKGGAK